MKKLFLLFATVTLLVGVQACKQKAEETATDATEAVTATVDSATAAVSAVVDSTATVVDAAKDAIKK